MEADNAQGSLFVEWTRKQLNDGNYASSDSKFIIVEEVQARRMCDREERKVPVGQEGPTWKVVGGKRTSDESCAQHHGQPQEKSTGNGCVGRSHGVAREIGLEPGVDIIVKGRTANQEMTSLIGSWSRTESDEKMDRG